jgi:hypothetical protein
MFKKNYLHEIDGLTEKFKISFQNLTEEEFNYKPKLDTWSVGQNIVHIILLNSSYFKHFTEIQIGNHNLYVNENTGTLAQNSLISVQPYTSSDRSKRANTWDIWQPSSGYIKKEILRDFEKHQLDFKNHIETFNDFPVQNTFIRYPGHADLIFKLGDCINFLIDHEDRHWNQAYEIINFFQDDTSFAVTQKHTHLQGTQNRHT